MFSIKEKGNRFAKTNNAQVAQVCPSAMNDHEPGPFLETKPSPNKTQETVKLLPDKDLKAQVCSVFLG